MLSSLLLLSLFLLAKWAADAHLSVLITISRLASRLTGAGRRAQLAGGQSWPARASDCQSVGGCSVATGQPASQPMAHTNPPQPLARPRRWPWRRAQLASKPPELPDEQKPPSSPSRYRACRAKLLLDYAIRGRPRAWLAPWRRQVSLARIRGAD